ncbi:MAG: hypothetical protein L6V93_14505 [Clostridiales bacterium]|nr:MAG: hypothetical protein L6V93_14505 [Clostridiales bacterium]
MLDRRIGAQYYTLREFLQYKKKILTKPAKKVSEIGYKVVQLSGLGDISANNVKEITDKYSLLPVLTHRPYKEFEENLDGLIDYHKTIGCKSAGLGAIPLDGAVSEDVLNTFLKNTTRLQKKLEKARHNLLHITITRLNSAKLKASTLWILSRKTRTRTLNLRWTFTGLRSAE